MNLVSSFRLVIWINLLSQPLGLIVFVIMTVVCNHVQVLSRVHIIINILIFFFFIIHWMLITYGSWCFVSFWLNSWIEMYLADLMSTSLVEAALHVRIGHWYWKWRYFWMNALDMSFQVSALRKRAVTEVADEGPLTIVFSEVVSQIAWLLEDNVASTKQALEVVFISLGGLIEDFDDSMPFVRYTFKLFLGNATVLNVFKIQFISKLLFQLLSWVANSTLSHWIAIYEVWHFDLFHDSPTPKCFIELPRLQ